MTQSYDASACEGGDVNDGAGFETLGIGERIAQNEAPFGVGVQNFNGLTTHAGDHVPRFQGFTARHVFAGGYQTHHIHRRFEPRQRFKGSQHAGSTAHVELHLVHARTGLQRNTARVKGDALADQYHRGLRSRSPLVLQHDEAKRLLGSLGHRSE